MDMLDFPMSIAEAKQIIKEGRPRHSNAKLAIAAHKMMDACRRETGEVTISDAFRCLEYNGAIATFGARCLYVLTGRDGLGWNSGPFVWDRADWESYLQKH
jgi:hypothetical protein